MIIETSDTDSRKMRLTMLKIHNDLKDIKNTIEECNDIWLSDAMQKLKSFTRCTIEFEEEPPKEGHGYCVGFMFAQ